MFTKHVHYSIELEQAILGACLLEKEAFGRLYGTIEADCFYSSGHQLIYASLKTMYEQGMMIDSYTLVDFIRRIKGISEINGDNVFYFVCQLSTHVVGTAHLEYHAFIVKSMWMEREIITLTHSGTNSYDGDAHQKIRSIQDRLFSLQQKTAQNDWQDISQLMVNLYRHQEEMKKSGGVGIHTGLNTLDKENGGFQNGQLIVIGARPSMGKSALIGGMAIEMGRRGHTTGIVSLEMSNNEIAARIAAYDTNTDFSVVFRGLYRDEKEAEVLYHKIANTTSRLPVFVSDKTKVNVPEIRAKAEKLKSLHGLKCLYIDYLQLVSSIGGSYSKSRENEIAEMSRGCKIMAKEMDIPVVLLCQLNREVTKRKGNDRYPQLSDLRESGAIEQDADVVMFLHRDFMAGYEQDENGNSTEKQGDLVVRKWRNGKSNFIIRMDFDGPKMKFTERQKQMAFVPISTGHSDDNPF